MERRPATWHFEGQRISRRLALERLPYLEIGQIRTIEVPGFSVIDNVSAIFCVGSHGPSAVALVVAPIDLFCGETETCSENWRWLEHCISEYNQRDVGSKVPRKLRQRSMRKKETVGQVFWELRVCP